MPTSKPYFHFVPGGLCPPYKSTALDPQGALGGPLTPSLISSFFFYNLLFLALSMLI